MATIHFCGGEVGGNGKTTFASLLIECYLKNNTPFQLRDADRSTPNVGWAYDPVHYPKENSSKSTAYSNRKNKNDQKPNEDQKSIETDNWKPLIFSEDLVDFSIADQLIILGKNTDLIVNLPSQVRVPFDKWFKGGDFSNMQDRLGIKFVYWWIAKPEQRSLDLLFENVGNYPKMPHVLVCNQLKNVGMDWTTILTEDFKKELKSKKITTIKMPELMLTVAEKVVLGEENPRFCDLIADDDDRISIASKIRCEVFMEEAFKNIIASGYFQPSPTEPKSQSDKATT